MLEFCVTISMCCALLFSLEGIDTAINSEANRIYKVTHIVYPLFIVGTLFYLLVSGEVK